MENNITKLTVFQRIMYGMGNMGGNFLNMIFTTWLYKMYCDPDASMGMLLPIAWMNMAFLSGRVVDAVADPLIGFWSDNTKTRWGRRIPFMMFGGLPLVISFYLLWAPPLSIFPPNSAVLFAYLCAVMAAFWFLFTAVLCPYLAIMPEVAVDESDRMNISSYMSLFMLISSGIVLGLGPVLVDKAGYAVMGLAFGLLGLIGLYAPVLVIKENFVKKETEESYDFISAFGWCFKNHAFRYYIASSVLGKIGFNAIMMGMPFIVTKILGKTDIYVAVIMGGAGVAAGIFFVIINMMSKKIEGKKIYMSGLAGFVILLPMVYLFGQYDLSMSLSFLGIDKVIPEFWVAFMVFSFAGYPIASFMVLPPTLLSDVIDLDELNTGHRREAMYFGAQGFVEKSGMAFSGVMMGTLMARYGNSVDNHYGIDLLGPVAAGFVLLGMIVFMGYPLSKAKMAEIREQVAAKKAAKA